MYVTFCLSRRETRNPSPQKFRMPAREADGAAVGSAPDSKRVEGSAAGAAASVEPVGAPQAEDGERKQTLLQALSKSISGPQTLHTVFKKPRVEFTDKQEPFLSDFHIVIKTEVPEPQNHSLRLEVVYLDSESKKDVLYTADMTFPQPKKYKFTLQVRPPKISEIDTRALLTGAVYCINAYIPTVNASKPIWSVPIHVLVTDPTGELKGYDEGSSIDVINSNSEGSSSSEDYSSDTQCSDFIEEEDDGESEEEGEGDAAEDAAVAGEAGKAGEERPVETSQASSADSSGKSGDEEGSECGESSSGAEPPMKKLPEPVEPLTEEQAKRLVRKASLLIATVPDAHYYTEDAPVNE